MFSDDMEFVGEQLFSVHFRNAEHIGDLLELCLIDRDAQDRQYRC